MVSGKVPMIGNGRFVNGKWHCECKQLAICRTAKNTGPNQGRKYWRCANDERDSKSCPLFFWDEHSNLVKEYIGIPTDPPPARTSTIRNGEVSEILGQGSTSDTNAVQVQSPETPFTKAKRKRVPKESPDQNHINSGESSKSARPPPPLFDAHPRFRKTARLSIQSDPKQRPEEKPGDGGTSLPTPNTGGPTRASDSTASGSSARQECNISPTPGRYRASLNLGLESESYSDTDLAERIVKLLHEQKLDLKVSTEMKLRHEVDMELEVREAKVRSYEGTISKLYKRIDDLESMVLNLTE